MVGISEGINISSVSDTGNMPDGTRYLGGSLRGETDHPFLTGNFYVFFGFPGLLFPSATDVAQRHLLVSAEEFTPHGDTTIRVADVEGQGGNGSSFITGNEISREFTLNYKDFWGAPIFNIHRKWNYINPYLGASSIAETYSAREYKGVCMVIQTKPVARGVDGTSSWSEDDIIKINYYDGVFPKMDLSSAYSATITDNTVVKPSITYSFDGFPIDETVEGMKSTAKDILNSSSLFNKTYNLYATLAGTNPNGGKVGGQNSASSTTPTVK